MRPIQVLGLAAVLSLLVGLNALAPASEVASHGDGIQVGDYYFCDPSFTNGVCDTSVVVGTEVAWEVYSGGHWINECDETFTVCPPPGGFDFSVVYVGEARYRTFSTEGVYEYRCDFHPAQMRGRILVSSAETPTPTPAPLPTAAPAANASPTPFVAATAAPTVAPPSAAAAALPGTGSALRTTGMSYVLLGVGGALLLIAALAFAVRRAKED